WPSWHVECAALAQAARDDRGGRTGTEPPQLGQRLEERAFLVCLGERERSFVGAADGRPQRCCATPLAGDLGGVRLRDSGRRVLTHSCAPAPVMELAGQPRIRAPLGELERGCG